MSGWQTIDSAPRDGTAIWLAVDGESFMGLFHPPTAEWDLDGAWFILASFRRRERPRLDEIFGTYAHGVEPTHWQPLPEPPEPSP